jgi:hypothetical protein
LPFPAQITRIFSIEKGVAAPDPADDVLGDPAAPPPGRGLQFLLKGPGDVDILFYILNLTVTEFLSPVGGAKLATVPTAVSGGPDEQGMIAAFAGGADGPHLKEEVLSVDGQPAMILRVWKGHKDNFGSGIRIVNMAKIPGGKTGEVRGFYKNLAITSTPLYPKVAEPGKKFSGCRYFLDNIKHVFIIIFIYYE